MKLQQILNLVRDEAERISDSGGLTIVTPAREADVRKAVSIMAHLALRAASAPVADLAALSDEAARMASARYLKRHGGHHG
ncbi:hypothetical protein MJO47_09200 [Desulfuromonas sp. KJ2020]|uniref:hypothetical protein n=1 Tax=Desulfuromonas sp. KJ2020 TaxID=2919173 RepID=UPI0020A74FCD|nr:hypothetical protein [Desulfuromonas sp. KJ2020]MCP3177273.1 hypothetical protein [Desulfuromonas sp. KJ2020]